MSLVDLVNLLVGVSALVLAVVSLLLSNRWNHEAAQAQRAAHDALTEARSLLNQISRAAEDIDESVEKRLDDLIKRAVPSPEEKAMTTAMEQFFATALRDPDVIKVLIQEGMKAQRSDREVR